MGEKGTAKECSQSFGLAKSNLIVLLISQKLEHFWQQYYNISQKPFFIALINLFANIISTHLLFQSGQIVLCSTFKM